jgi:hypothetical protein
MTDIKPDFFIIGGQRCGTTALSNYLDEHPEICISRPKEPHYFATDFPAIQKVKTFDKYQMTFSHCQGEIRRFGDASTGYLFSNEAVSNIYDFDPSSLIIIMLRNPVDLVYSLHAHLLFLGFENIRNFEDAWNAQASRREGINLPKNRAYERFLQYGELGMLGDQVEKVLKIFPNDQVKMIIFDDFVTRTAEVYHDLLQYLNVSRDGRKEFRRVNENIEYTFPWYYEIREMIPLRIRVLNERVLKKLHLKRNIMRRIFAKKVKRQKMSEALRRTLVDYFSQDIDKLSNLIERDLSSWKTIK